MRTDNQTTSETPAFDVIDNRSGPLGPGAIAALLSEVHASLLVHEDLSHLADGVEDLLFDVMVHARERDDVATTGKPRLVIAK